MSLSFSVVLPDFLCSCLFPFCNSGLLRINALQLDDFFGVLFFCILCSSKLHFLLFRSQAFLAQATVFSVPSRACVLREAMILSRLHSLLTMTTPRREMAHGAQPRSSALCKMLFCVRVQHTRTHLHIETRNKATVHVHQLRHNIWITHQMDCTSHINGFWMCFVFNWFLVGFNMRVCNRVWCSLKHKGVIPEQTV